MRYTHKYKVLKKNETHILIVILDGYTLKFKYINLSIDNFIEVRKITEISQFEGWLLAWNGHHAKTTTNIIHMLLEVV